MILQTHAAVCGGVSEWRRIAAMVAGFGVTVCLHWFDDHLVHLVAATPSAPARDPEQPLAGSGETCAQAELLTGRAQPLVTSPQFRER